MNLDDIVHSSITRQTAVASLPGFGVPAILAQFATTKTTTAFGRYRYYGTPAELLADGWLATDSVYLAALAMFSQNPRAPRIMVGRIDTGDASVAASGDAIRAAQDDWYAFEVVGNRGIEFTLSTDLIADNSIASSINGITVAPVVYGSTHAATMDAWATAIETALGAGTVATVSGDVMSVVKPGTDLNVGTCVVTLGASQPTVVTAYPLDATKTKAWMAWAETVVKDYGFQDSDPRMLAANTGVSGTASLSEYAKLSSYKRTFSVYHADHTEYAMSAWIGRELPQPVGSKLWAFTNLSGVIADNLTTGEVTNLRAKNTNFYTTTANYSHTYAGVQADGNQIDQLRGLDWLNSNIKVAVFNLMASTKLTITDRGYNTLYGTVLGQLARAESQGVLVPGSSTVQIPLAANVPAEDKAAGIMSGTTWDSLLQIGALEVVITGTVSA